MKFDLVVPTAKETRRRLFSRFIHTNNFPGQDQFHPQWSRYCAAFKFQLIIVVLIYYFLQGGGSGPFRHVYVHPFQVQRRTDQFTWHEQFIWRPNKSKRATSDKRMNYGEQYRMQASAGGFNWLPKRCGGFSSGKDSPREWCQRECVSFQLKAIHFTWDVSFQVSNVPIISHPAHRSAAMKRITWTKGSFGTLFKSAIAHLARRKQLEREDKWNRNNTNVLKE